MIDKDVASNIVYIAHGSAPTRTGRRELIAEQIHWIAGAPEQAVLQVKLRHGPALTPCEVQMLAPDHAHVSLSTPDPGIAPGQHAVFYDGDICLGGGVIA